VIRAFGEAALLVELGAPARVQALAASLLSDPLPGVAEVVPGVETLLVELALPLRDGLEADLAARVEGLSATAPPPGRERRVPCSYGGGDGPDLDEVARLAGMTAAEVIERHAAATYTVELLGFAAGFAYLGGLPGELAVPRLESPRTATPAGSVAIAGRQSGIYPADLPGGWRVVGRTSVALFDPRRDPPTYLAPGDRVRFIPVVAADLDRYAGAPSDW
jgi:KipI family sensor histidine kinase inhibitor